MSDEPSIQLLVLYDHPKDFPRHIATRWQDATLRRGGSAIRHRPVACLYDTLDEAILDTEAFYGPLPFLNRSPDDDPVIMGMWIA